MAPSARTLDTQDRQLLNLVQSTFPLVPAPYQAIGEQLGFSEQETLERLSRLKQQHLIRQISAIFDTRRLGYDTSLVAVAYSAERLAQGALRINQHPGVSHNYGREGSNYNLWFTLALPPGESIEETVQQLAQETQASSFRIMRTIRFFKIGVNFDMLREEGAAHEYYRPDANADRWAGDGHDSALSAQGTPLSTFEKAAIRELQQDLPLEPRPFLGMSERLGLEEQPLLSLANEFIARGIMRRYSAILHHRNAGFHANAMGVWQVPEERAQDVGEQMASSPAVSHCYQRPTFNDWPYTHFTMIHATTKQGCEEVARQISRDTGIADYRLLYSTREYKKTRVQYFE